METKQNKTKRVTVRFTEAEYRDICKKAKQANMKLSSFISLCLRKGGVTVITDLNDITAQLRKIGNNLNQLVTLCNMGKLTTLSLSDVRDELTAIKKSLVDRLNTGGWW